MADSQSTFQMMIYRPSWRWKIMGDRRMLSRRVTDSTKFLKMPMSSQALYFHLVLGADDDGVVEAFAVMRKIGAANDDMRLLVAKNFVIVLNEDMVTYITDWNENNNIRADRKVDSIYQQLLLQVVPDAPIKKAKKRADTKKTKQISSQSQPQLTSGQPMDVQWTAQDKLREGKLREDKLSKVNSVEESEKENSSPTKATVYDLYQENFGVISPFIVESIDYDIKEHGEELVIEAMKRARLNQANYKYAQGILESWSKQGVKTMEDVKASDVEHNQKKKIRSGRQPVQRETLPDWATDDNAQKESTTKKVDPAVQAVINEQMAALTSRRNKEV